MIGDMTIKEQTKEFEKELLDIKNLLKENNELLKEQIQLLKDLEFHFIGNKC